MIQMAQSHSELSIEGQHLELVTDPDHPIYKMLAFVADECDG